jgi:hypothetical protein
MSGSSNNWGAAFVDQVMGQLNLEFAMSIDAAKLGKR